jgi:nitroreductase
MRKTADSRFPIHDLIAQRWSPRSFTDRDVAPDTLRSLLEAARWAPSSRNQQPWFFFVARREDQEDYQRLFDCLSEGNRRWAGRAPVLILSVAQLHFDRGGRANRYAVHDVGLAVANLIVQATALGLHAHQMAGFDKEQAREIFDIPQGYDPVTVIALGYLGAVEDLPEALREREMALRMRRPLDEFVFANRWGQISPLLADQD